jgi:hypothetical protein
MFNLTQICIIDITMGTYVYNIDLVWYIFLVVLNSHSKPILVKRSWNHLQKLIIQEPVLFYNHIKSAASIILLMNRSWGLLVWISTRCGMQFLEGWYLLQGGEHNKTAAASCSPSSPRVNLVSPHHKSRTYICELEILSPHSVHLHCHLKVMLDHV